MAKHTLSEHADSDSDHSSSTPKRRRTASPLPRSTPPRDRNGDVDFDPDAQDDDDDDDDEDADMSDDEETRRQVARLQQTQSSRPTVRPPRPPSLPLARAAALTLAAHPRRRSQRPASSSRSTCRASWCVESSSLNPCESALTSSSPARSATPTRPSTSARRSTSSSASTARASRPS